MVLSAVRVSASRARLGRMLVMTVQARGKLGRAGSGLSHMFGRMMCPANAKPAGGQSDGLAVRAGLSPAACCPALFSLLAGTEQCLSALRGERLLCV